ncbi:hypothetical protein [Streptomyces alkaliterrae]|uniref:Uncharacterized protein n=1 Tax=Streptomyces alkaliterrae TaxID=2213162 RepID=A0A5P0YTU1_9ACTN|nr:hypothetical protein [Streptomyces alkaliterrae]MBB1255767.1 hypothetical protein [Streptomyces alkaliterrae]MBB1258250.1 hypothetical protein [Streptomyces alkaliterrae]MQS03733.1 hypothetical protein [Streptomyces alkaliterrae]
MTTGSDIRWEREEDDRWAANFEIQFRLEHRPPAGLTERILSEVHEMVTETGVPARELFGDARQYADSLAGERIDDSHVSKTNLAGDTAGGVLTTTLVYAGIVGCLLSLGRWLRANTAIEVSAASLVGVGSLVVAALTLCLAVALRTAGRRSAFAASTGTCLVSAAIGAAAFTALSQQVLFSLPVWVPLAVSGALTVAAHRLPDSTADEWLRPRRTQDGEAWLAHLEALLRGRHGLSAQAAREHVAEARAHLAETPGTTARKAFGDVEMYALGLGGGPRRTERVNRRKARLAVLSALLIAGLCVLKLTTYVAVGSFWFWFLAVAVAVWIAQAGLWLANRHQQAS